MNRSWIILQKDCSTLATKAYLPSGKVSENSAVRERYINILLDAVTKHSA